MSKTENYDGPPDYRNVGQHGMFPDLSHDEVERFNFLAHLNRHLATNVLPGVQKAYDGRIKPNNPLPNNRHQVRKQLLKDPVFQTWSAMRRSTMELRQQAGRWVAQRQADDLNAKAKALTDGDPRLILDPDLELPRYLSAVDHHCMPGSYHDELVEGDVTGPANYDIGIFCTTGGGLGRYNDGGGQAVVAWMKKNRPDFAPKKILDIGGGLGQNVLPIAQAYLDAEVVCVDTGAPSLRYGLARAKEMGVEIGRTLADEEEATLPLIDEDDRTPNPYLQDLADMLRDGKLTEEQEETVERTLQSELFKELGEEGLAELRRGNYEVLDAALPSKLDQITVTQEFLEMTFEETGDQVFTDRAAGLQQDKATEVARLRGQQEAQELGRDLGRDRGLDDEMEF